MTIECRVDPVARWLPHGLVPASIKNQETYQTDVVGFADVDDWTGHEWN